MPTNLTRREIKQAIELAATTDSAADRIYAMLNSAEITGWQQRFFEAWASMDPTGHSYKHYMSAPLVQTMLTFVQGLLKDLLDDYNKLEGCEITTREFTAFWGDL